MNRQQFLAIGLAVIMVFAAGCAGWGTNGPADPDNTIGEPNEDSNPNADESTDDSNTNSDSDLDDDSDSDSSSNSDDSDSDSGSDTDSESDDSDSSDESGSDADSGSDSDDSDSPSSPANAPDSDSTSDSDSGSDSDSDSNGSGDSDNNDSDNGDGTGDGDGNGDADDNESYAYDLTIGVRDDNPEYGEGVENELVTVEQGGKTDEYYTDRFGIVEITKYADSPDESFEYTVTVQDQTKTVTVTEGYNSVEFIVPYIPIGGPKHTLTVDAGEALVATGAEISVAYPDDGQVIETKTVEDGSVTFSLSDGDYVVSGEDVNGMTDQQNVTIDGEDTSVMLAGLYPEFPEENELTVSVVDIDGDPIEGATVDGVSGRHPTGP